jgi:hypothetical protein
MPKKYTKQQLIELLQTCETPTYDYLNSKQSTLPAATTYRHYFGSWENALKSAGIEPNKCTLKSTKPTTVYLVEFDQGFYKIGITQRSISARLDNRYPNYKIILQLETSLEEAKLIEKMWLEAVKPLKYTPSNFPAEPRGHSECFKY